MNKIKVLMIICVAALVCSNQSIAQKTGLGESNVLTNNNANVLPNAKPESRVDKMAKFLQLSEDQKLQVQDVIKKNNKDRKLAKEEGDFDKEASEKSLDVEIEKVLTDEQFQKYLKGKEARKKKIDKRRAKRKKRRAEQKVGDN